MRTGGNTKMNAALVTESPQPPRPPNRWTGRLAGRWATLDHLGIALFGLLAYLPVLATSPGRVVADTKSYLTIDPGRFLADASSLWDPHIGLGTVSHQTVGYLFPMGPFYWVFQEVLGVPGWVTQRLWLGTLIFAAGLGMRYLLRTLDVRGAGLVVGVLAYALTPYVLQYSSRLSVLLSPWAGLPWMLTFVIRGLRARPWRYAALIAITVQLVGAVNLPALLYALIGPALWIPYAVWIRRDADWPAVWRLTWRTVLLTVVASLWWATSLVIQAEYGLSILRFTESIESVSATSTATEILRGLGYWFFYGADRRGYWNDAVLDLNRKPFVIAASFSIPLFAMIAAAVLRWRDRAYFVVMALIAVTIAVAASPYHNPTVLGSIIKSWATGSTVGLALRSTSRALPLMVLAFAVLLAVAMSAIFDALRRRGHTAVGVGLTAGIVLLCVVGNPGVWHGRYYSRYLERPQTIPSYWTEAARALDQRPHTTRILGLPGADFAAYRWGDTIDPIEPGILARDYVARELVPWGSEASANLLIALDQRLQGAILDPAAVAPIARLMGAGDVLLRLDLETDRFSLIPSRALWEIFTRNPPPGLDPPRTFGTEIPGKLRYPDLGNLAEPAKPEPAPVAVFSVKDPLPIVRAKTAHDPIIVDGDGEGLVDLASAGLLDARRLVVYSPKYEGRPAALRTVTGTDGALVVTDSNRRRGMRWASMSSNYGYTEQAGEKPLKPDLLDQRLDVFPDTTDATRSVTTLDGLESTRATTYGTPSFGFSPDARPAAAIDGRLLTSWEVASGLSAVGPETLRITLDAPITTDEVHLVQPFGANRGRWITKIRMRFDDGHEVTRMLDASSRARRGQTVTFPRRTFSVLELQIAGTVGNKVGKGPSEKAQLRKTGVGFAEVTLHDNARPDQPVRATESIRLPNDLLSGLGAGSLDHPLALVMTRNETELRREFTLPTARDFVVTGTMQLSPNTADEIIDTRLGIPDVSAGGITVTYGKKTPVGQPITRASAAVDGDPTTEWQTRAKKVRGDALNIRLPAPITIDRMDVQVQADGRHSVPTQLRLDTGTETRFVDLPPVAAGNQGVVTLPVRFAPLTTDRLRIALTGVRVEERPSGTFGTSITLPAAIVDFGIPGVQQGAPPVDLPAGCITDLLSIDGTPFPIRLSGTTADALDGRPIRFSACDPAATLALAPGSHSLYGLMNSTTGLDFSRVVMSSAAGGAASGPEVLLGSDQSRPRPTPTATVLDRSSTSYTVEITDASRPTWLVVGQSLNPGWHATLNGADLGPAQLVDGYANGWRIDPRGEQGPLRVSVEWTPQQNMRIAFILSILGMLACLAIVIGSWWRARRRIDSPPTAGPPAESASEPVDRSLLVNPFRIRGQRPARTTIAVTAVGAGLAAGILTRPWTAVPVTILVIAALLSPRARGLLRILPAALMFVILAWVTSGQLRHNYPPAFAWPTFFERLRTSAWLVVVLLAVDGIVSLVWRDDRPPDLASDEPVSEPERAPLPEPSQPSPPS